MRCVCYDRTIVDIVEQALQNGWDVEQIKNNTKCGSRCGLCVPYIQSEIGTQGATHNSVP
jgi:NAD(P)H-nitrite reductase large subunit